MNTAVVTTITSVVGITFTQRYRTVTIKYRRENAIRTCNKIIASRTHTAIGAITRLVEHFLKIIQCVIEFQISKINKNHNAFGRTGQREGGGYLFFLETATHFLNTCRLFSYREISYPFAFIVLANRRTI